MKEEEKFQKFFVWRYMDFELWPPENYTLTLKKLGKNIKLATLNELHLSYGALRANSINSSYYCDSLG